MQARHTALLRKRHRTLHQRKSRFVIRRQHTRAGARRERHGSQQLRIILTTCPTIRIRPRPVKHVFAIRMRLQIQRHGTDQFLRLVSRKQVTRRPPRALAHTAGRLQRVQIGVGEENISTGSGDQRIPFLRRNGRKRINNFDLHHRIVP